MQGLDLLVMYCSYELAVLIATLQIYRPESIMLQNLPILLFGISLVFCLLCLFLCFLDMDYADMSYF